MIDTLAIANYRSLYDLVLPMSPLTLITGANGSGKSNLYNALQLLAEAVTGNVVGELARQGGLPSTLWAGPATVSRAMERGEVEVQGGPQRGPTRVRPRLRERRVQLPDRARSAHAVAIGLSSGSGDQARSRLERPGCGASRRSRSTVATRC